MEEIELQTSNHTDRTARDHASVESTSASTHSVARLLRDPQGRYMFIGDSANLSFLQTIRKVVKDSIGECPLTEDPLRYVMVEPASKGAPTWLRAAVRQPPPKPTLAEATYLVRRYCLAANCVLDLFDDTDLPQNLAPWLEKDSVEPDARSTMYYLVFALGAQTCPEDKEELAETYFSYGRYYTAVSFTEDPSIPTVQAYALITMYLLNASRRNAAFMNLGIGVRAAYALGLHRKEVAALFAPAEFKTRERLWKVIRILDLFMSSSLGRPPVTAETRDTQSTDNYSPSVDLCAIFETILNEVYSKRMISTEALFKISALHRHWAVQFQQGLAVDGIAPTETLDGDGGKLLNIGFLHIKEAYYWTIMLLTRPFLVDAVSSYAPTAVLTPLDGNENCVSSRSEKVLVHACVDSAIRTIDLLRILLDYDDIPKRLPFVVNSIFVSALVLGLAHFGDLYKVFPLASSIDLGRQLLARFPHDAIARRNETIVGRLIQACNAVNEKRSKVDRERQTLLVGEMFGTIHEDQLSTGLGRPTAHNTSTTSAPSSGSQPGLFPQTMQAQPLAAVGQDDYHQPGPDVHSGPAFDLSDQDKSFAEDSGLVQHAESDVLSEEFMDANMEFGVFGGSMLHVPMSPRTLWFGSYNEKFPLFSTTDASAA